MEQIKMGLPMKTVFSIFPTGALAALVVWLVYAIKYSDKGEDIDDKLRTNSHKYTIAFQAIVAVTLLYFLLHHHMNLLLVD
jgi:hypothetical protein